MCCLPGGPNTGRRFLSELGSILRSRIEAMGRTLPLHEVPEEERRYGREEAW
ncbi:hypothetical protein LINPERPRIM_LOCUS43564 [Linum perenne]